MLSIVGTFALLTGGAAVWIRTRPVETALYSFPSGADVYEGASPLGRTDTVIPLSRGRHRLRVSREGFRDCEWVIEVPWDGRAHNRAILLPGDAPNPSDSKDPRVHQAYAEDAAGEYALHAPQGPVRSASVQAVRALWPRGAVAIQDLSSLTFELDPERLTGADAIELSWEPGGGSRRVLQTRPIGRTAEPISIAVPRELLEETPAGGSVTWSIRALRSSGLTEAEASQRCVATLPASDSEPGPDPRLGQLGIPAGARAAAQAIRMLRAGRLSAAAKALGSLDPKERSLYTELLLADVLDRLELIETAIGLRCRRAREAAFKASPTLIRALERSP